MIVALGSFDVGEIGSGSFAVPVVELGSVMVGVVDLGSVGVIGIGSGLGVKSAGGDVPELESILGAVGLF